MTSEQPRVVKTGRYSLKEAAAALAVSTRTLYRHTLAGMINCERRKCNGRPVYTGNEILRYWGASY